MHEAIPLTAMAMGECGAVADVLGCADAVHRLGEMGLRPGAAIEMIQAGQPCIVRLDGLRLCLRADEVFNVLVRVGVAS